jgi:ApeA N-terminal domain 1
MREKKKSSWESGHFKLDKERDLFGELKINGTKSRLYLYDTTLFNPRSIGDAVVTRVLQDLTKVSLLDCVPLKSGAYGGPKEKRNYLHLFPHFVVWGEQHLRPKDKVITHAEFLVDDASTLFYDFDAFSTVLDAGLHITELTRTNARRINRKIPVGSNPIIQYFTGKHQIVKTKTVLGEISAFHQIQHGLGGPEGVSIKNSIWLTIRFDKKRAFHEAQSDIVAVLRFVEIVIGRRQNLLKVNLRRGSFSREDLYRVLWSHPWRRKDSSREKPHPGDVLLDPIRGAKEFSRVLKGWLQRDEDYSDARGRFACSFSKGSRFSVDRLIGCANAFDILPASAVPADVELAADVLKAKAEAKKIFKDLRPSPERDSVLNTLGRIGKSTLKQKVRHRAQLVIDAIGESLPDLVLAADEAVNCRNYYVHGGDARFNYQENFDVFVFLTETLEFIFAASELVECGWDIRAWKRSRSGITNPVGRYLINYRPLLLTLKKALQPPS